MLVAPLLESENLLPELQTPQLCKPALWTLDYTELLSSNRGHHGKHISHNASMCIGFTLSMTLQKQIYSFPDK